MGVGISGKWSPSGVGVRGELSFQADRVPRPAAGVGHHAPLPLVPFLQTSDAQEYNFSLHSYCPRVFQEACGWLARGRIFF